MEDYKSFIQIKVLDKQELFNIFNSFIEKSNINIDYINYDKKLPSYHLNYDNKSLEIVLFIKNISDSGKGNTADKLRLQIPDISNAYFETEKNRLFLLCGLTYYNNKPILVIWDAKRYIYHKTSRSAYIGFADINKVYFDGFLEKYDANGQIFACDDNNLKNAIEGFYEFSYCEELTW